MITTDYSAMYRSVAEKSQNLTPGREPVALPNAMLLINSGKRVTRGAPGRAEAEAEKADAEVLPGGLEPPSPASDAGILSPGPWELEVARTYRNVGPTLW